MRKWNDLSKVEQLITTYSDFYKDTHGFRPAVNHDWTEEYVQNIIDELSITAEIISAEKKIERNKAIIDFERILKKVKNICNSTRNDAIKFLMDAENVENDKEYFCYKMNLPYGYFNEVI